MTGSHIRGAGAGPSPLAVIDRADLQRSGQMTVAEALSVLPQNFNGQGTDLATTTGTDNRGINGTYDTGVNLRGLGSDATLVLVNGRRLGGAGAKGDFTDISTLPNIALDRVEILLDGASAIYGSDAVGGVVNVLLRRDLNGGEARVEGGVGEHGVPREGQVGLIEGRQWDSGGVVLAYELYHRSALLAGDRSFAATADLRPQGGGDFRTPFSHPGNIAIAINGVITPFYAIPAGQNGVGLTPASFTPNTVNLANPHLGVSILPDQERQSAYLAVHQSLGAHVELTGDVVYGFRRARTTLAYPQSQLTVTAANPFFVSPNGTTSDRVQYSFRDDLPSPVSRGTAEMLAVTAGAKVDLWGDWRSDSFFDVSQEIEEGRVHGILNSTLLAEALGNVADRPTTAYSPARDGFFNPFTGISANTPAVRAAIGSGFTSSRRESRVYTASTQADGALFRLPAGAVKLAVGAQYRKETFNQVGTNYTSTVAPVPQQGTDVERSVGAVFAETRVPLFGPDYRRSGLERLELNAAVRWEHYSDFGTTVNPKVGMLWSPVDTLNLRATYGRSFRAPGLRELHDPAFNTPVLLGVGQTQVLSLLLTGGNPGLRPETANSWTAGFDWRPQALPGLRLSATWFDVRYRNRIDQPVNAVLDTALQDPTVSSFVRRLDPANAGDLVAISALLASPATSTSQGSFPANSYGAIVDSRYVNTGSLEVEGLDATASYGFDLAGGRLQLAATGSDLIRYAQALTPTSAALERQGLAGFPARYRGRLTTDWTRGPLTLGAALNRTSAFKDLVGRRIDSLTTLDLQLRAAGPAASRWAGTTFSVNLRNVFNTDPPFYNSSLGYGFDAANADVVGRFVSIQITKSW
ncbi:TonB-dependent receptor plug domain-containing protein [Phenylobacterium sp.]|uniref:TonB-dependent receptor plug domain-containing protein n=1 Tax=Phenylobacterium sp. TaxID=1871053 RepID=UPI00356B41DC